MGKRDGMRENVILTIERLHDKVNDRAARRDQYYFLPRYRARIFKQKKKEKIRYR